VGQKKKLNFVDRCYIDISDTSVCTLRVTLQLVWIYFCSRIPRFSRSTSHSWSILQVTWHQHKSVILLFHCYTAISLLYCHFIVTLPFHCYVAISLLYCQFTVILPFHCYTVIWLLNCHFIIPPFHFYTAISLLYRHFIVILPFHC